MSRKTEIMTAACTLGCAVGIGFVMQSGEIAELRYGSQGELTALSTMPLVGQPAVPIQVTDLTISKEDEMLDVQDITLTSAKIGLPANAMGSQLDVVPASAPTDILEDGLEPELALGPECAISARAVPTAAAMINLTLDAPCYAGERVTIMHEGLIFSQNLSQEGKLDVSMPALVEDVRVSISFLNGESIAAFADVASVALYDRVILQWSGNPGVELHAREFGADYGTAGHVWAGAARNFSAVVGARGGFLTRLGDPAAASPKLAEVYTFPSVLSETEGAVDLTVETEVTEVNCGTEISARTFQFASGKEVSSQYMRLSVPNCGAVGNYLVLNNLLQDLTLARKN